MFGAWSALLGRAVARSRRRAGSLLAVAVGVAAAAAVVLAAAPLTLVARQTSMERTLAKASPADRSMRLSVQRTGGRDGGSEQLAQLQSDVNDGFGRVDAQAVRFSGRVIGRSGSVVLAGVEGLAKRVLLDAGRLPRGCDERACEVVAVTDGKLPRVFALQGLRMRVVGHGHLDGVPLGALPPRAGRFDAESAFVVADGVGPLLDLDALYRMPRSFMWTRVVDPATVHPWNTDAVLRGFAAVQDRFTGTVDGAQVAVPAVAISAEAARGRAAAAFALIIAGLAATVLLAFAAAEQHDDVARELTRLRAMAARRRHLVALVLGEAAVPAAAGVAVGAAVAAAASAALGGPDILRERFLTTGTLVAALVLWAAAVLVIGGVLGGAQSRSVRVALEAGCVVVLGGLVWQAASRGRVDVAELASGGTVDPAASASASRSLARWPRTPT